MTTVILWPEHRKREGKGTCPRAANSAATGTRVRYRPVQPFVRHETGNIATPNKSFPGEHAANRPKILPAIFAKIVIWRDFPGNDRPAC